VPFIENAVHARERTTIGTVKHAHYNPRSTDWTGELRAIFARLQAGGYFICRIEGSCFVNSERDSTKSQPASAAACMISR
jgi:hypothetical protein